MTKPDFIMMIGASASGKSTRTEDMAASRPGAVILSSDRIIEEMAELEGIGYQSAYKRFKDEAEAKLLQDARDAFAAGRSVIWDQTNLNASIRRARLEMVPASYRKRAVCFDVGLQELLDRVGARHAEGGREIPEFVVRAQVEQMEFPGEDEGFDLVEIVCDNREHCLNLDVNDVGDPGV